MRCKEKGQLFAARATEQVKIALKLADLFILDLCAQALEDNLDLSEALV